MLPPYVWRTISFAHVGASRRLLGKLTGKSKASSKGSKQGKSGRGSAEPELVAIREEDLRVLSFIKSKNVPKGVSHLCWLQSPKSAAGELGVQPSDCCIQLYPHRQLRKGRALCLCGACSFGASGLQPGHRRLHGLLLLVGRGLRLHTDKWQCLFCTPERKYAYRGYQGNKGQPRDPQIKGQRAQGPWAQGSWGKPNLLSIRDA